MLFRKKQRTKPNVPDGCHAYLRLTDKGLTYFSRMTFQNELERLGIRHAEGEWETIAEMVWALDGTGLSSPSRSSRLRTCSIYRRDGNVSCAQGLHPVRIAPTTAPASAPMIPRSPDTMTGDQRISLSVQRDLK